MYCQACGARNSDEAKFCNMCGARIAREGEPGGPLASGRGTSSNRDETASTTSAGTASATHSTTSITLAGIGVQSPVKVWSILIGGALGFLALGAAGAWLAMRAGTSHPEATTTGDAPSESDSIVENDADAVEVGDPIPVGDDAPEGGVIISSGPRLREARSRVVTAGSQPGREVRVAVEGRGESDTRAVRSDERGSARGDSMARVTDRSVAGPASRTGSESGSVSGSTGASVSGSGAASGAGGASVSGSGAASGAGAESSSGSGSGPASSGSTRDWAAMEGTVADEDRDLQMEHYAVQVRRFIRNYYVQRASACWDHESRTDGEVVRGAVVIAFTIGRDGRVESATVARNTTNRPSLGQCLQRNVASWQLPAPPRGSPVEMEMPFSR